MQSGWRPTSGQKKYSDHLSQSAYRYPPPSHYLPPDQYYTISPRSSISRVVPLPPLEHIHPQIPRSPNRIHSHSHPYAHPHHPYRRPSTSDIHLKPHSPQRDSHRFHAPDRDHLPRLPPPRSVTAGRHLPPIRADHRRPSLELFKSPSSPLHPLTLPALQIGHRPPDPTLRTPSTPTTGLGLITSPYPSSPKRIPEEWKQWTRSGHDPDSEPEQLVEVRDIKPDLTSLDASVNKRHITYNDPYFGAKRKPGQPNMNFLPNFSALANGVGGSGAGAGATGNQAQSGGQGDRNIPIDPTLSDLRSSGNNTASQQGVSSGVAPELRFPDEATLNSATGTPGVTDDQHDTTMADLAAAAVASEAEASAGGNALTVPGSSDDGMKKDQPFSRSPELRVSHKLAERKRRKEMKDLFDELRELLPAERGTKSSKWEILSKSIDFISNLKTMNNELVRELDKLRRDLDIARGGTGAYTAHSGYHYPGMPFPSPATAAALQPQASAPAQQAAQQAQPPAQQQQQQFGQLNAGQAQSQTDQKDGVVGEAQQRQGTEGTAA